MVNIERVTGDCIRSLVAVEFGRRAGISAVSDLELGISNIQCEWTVIARFFELVAIIAIVAVDDFTCHTAFEYRVSVVVVWLGTLSVRIRCGGRRNRNDKESQMPPVKGLAILPTELPRRTLLVR
jgi:hypothetical protein